MPLHPVLDARLNAVYADPRCEGLVRGVSGSRTKGEQIVLWNGYQNKLAWAKAHLGVQGWPNPYRNFNTAANPYILVGAAPGTSLYDLVGLREGSWHMEQLSKTYGLVGYAEDINWSEIPNRLYGVVEQVMAENRLIRTVFTPQYERWHWQMAWDDWTWVPGAPPPEPIPDFTPQIRLILEGGDDMLIVKHSGKEYLLYPSGLIIVQDGPNPPGSTPWAVTDEMWHDLVTVNRQVRKLLGLGEDVIPG